MNDSEEVARAVSLAVEYLGLRLEVYAVDGWPLRSMGTCACATIGIASGAIQGFGGAAHSEDARAQATIECVERFAQFRTDAPAPVAVAPWNAVRGRALSPDAFGLYDPAQYRASEFPCRPFDPGQPLEWIEATDLSSRETWWVPYEFVYPRAKLQRAPLVCETSSGCAAHVDVASATLAALCEVVERDAAMLFWYRQPPTPTVTAEDMGVPELNETVDQIRRLGYVVVIGCLDYDLGIPCYLAVALQGQRFAYGLGCHPNSTDAYAHALRELAAGLLWDHLRGEAESMRRGFASVYRREDHYQLYQCIPGHDVLRQVLARTLRAPGTVVQREMPVSNAPSEMLAATVGALATRGFRSYACDITPPLLRDGGLRVLRALVPGLVPLHFGFNALRLGCERLSGATGPGRLRQILPHFLH